MAAIKARDSIWSVGVMDSKLRVFDIIMETKQGTTYNSFLVRSGNKTALIECVKDKFSSEWLDNIREVCDPADIDYIVLNHTEPDHSGSLLRILKLAPKAVVLASNTAITFLGELLNQSFEHQVVADRDVVELGDLQLQFLSAPMLHWPDTQFTYIPQLKALFTCDMFGCHHADSLVFNDLIKDMESFSDAYRYYFDNIMGPYKNPHVLRALDKIEALQIDFIGTGHGPILRTNIQYYLDLYRKWSTPNNSKEKTVVMVYVSAYGYTRELATTIQQSLLDHGVAQVECYDLVEDNMHSAQSALSAADAILLGSCTMVGDALPPIYEALLCLNPVCQRGKLAGAFGCYAWSGEAVPNLTARLEQLRMSIPVEGLRVRLKPSAQDLQYARDFGANFAKALQES